jgi:hypothetical protein
VLHAGPVFNQCLLLHIGSAVTRLGSTGTSLMSNREYNVLFLCSGNSARSIMAECALNRWAKESSEASARGAIPKVSCIR